MKVFLVKNKKQLAEAYEVRKTVFVDEQHVPVEEEIDSFEEVAEHFLVYDDNEQPIGAGRLRILQGCAKVERICILKPFRGTGVGKVLMTFIEQHAATQHINVLKLNAQTHAIPFYKALGYQITSEEFLDAGIPHRSMEKILTVKSEGK